MNQAASGTKKRSKILSMALIALFAALTAVLSQIAIPTPWQIPISLGNLAGFLAVGLLTWEEAALSQVVWVLLGVVGAPVFSGMGSLSRLVGPTGGYIIGYIVSAVAAGRTVCLSVADTGPGIADKERAFQKFYRADPQTGDASLGLGLSIAQKLVALHHGSITIRDTPGGGATLQVTIPQA